MRETTRLVEIDAPPYDGGAPMPVVIQDDGRLVFGYDMLDEGEALNRVAVCAVDRCLVSTFGYPNEEALMGHRYHGRGLHWYGAHEVLDSEWISAIIAANRVHRGHRDEMFSVYRHFIFTFHDSTLEFIATEKPVFAVAVGSVFDLVAARYRSGRA